MDKVPILIMDGGMASELEHLGFQMPTADTWPNPWSSSALVSDYDLVKQVHGRYLDAGATVLSTCTYQLSLEAVASPVQAQNLMERAVTAVNEMALQSTAPCLKLLSLGPCAVIHPSGTEYTGMYQLPYSSPQSGAMERFHLSRLQLLTKANWSMIEGILFETISLISEITAIRKSVSLSRVEQNLEDKDLFISMVFPSGRLPGWDIEPCISDERNHITEISTETGMQAIVDATFTPFMGQAMVRGIGINCTKPQCLKELVNSLTQAISKIPRGEPPTLLLYPDGGVEWENNGFKGGISIEEWCRDVWDSVQLALKAGPGVWGRLIVGGCCNTGPAHIQRLHEIVSQSDA